MLKFIKTGPISTKPATLHPLMKRTEVCSNDFCLFVWSLSSHSRIFHSYEDVTFAGKGLQILTYARHSWPLSSEGSLRCHTYCDTGTPLQWSSPRTRGTHTCCRAFGSCDSQSVFTTQVCRHRGYNLISRLRSCSNEEPFNCLKSIMGFYFSESTL